MWVNISIDVAEVYEELSEREKYQLLDWLENDGITRYTSDGASVSLMREAWGETCTKLSHLYYQMTNDELVVIEKIVKKYL